MPDAEPNPALLRELVYVPLIPWQCTQCGASGHVESSEYQIEIFERAWSAHEISSPICCREFSSSFVLIKEPQE